MEKEQYEPAFARRRKIIGVMGGANDYPALTKPLGELIAKLNHHLLTGAGDGIMAAVSEAFYKYPDRAGLVLGIVRAAPVWVEKHQSRLQDYAPNKINPWVEVPIYTHLPLSSADIQSRNHINALTSDVIIAMPGKSGTASEVELALGYGTPVVFFTGEGKINDKTPDFYTKKHPSSKATVSQDIAEVETALHIYLKTGN